MVQNSRSIYAVILPALILMVAAVLLFTVGTQPYGEISLGNKTDLAKQILKARQTCLDSAINQMGTQKNALIM